MALTMCLLSHRCTLPSVVYVVERLNVMHVYFLSLNGTCNQLCRLAGWLKHVKAIPRILFRMLAVCGALLLTGIMSCCYGHQSSLCVTVHAGTLLVLP